MRSEDGRPYPGHYPWSKFSWVLHASTGGKDEMGVKLSEGWDVFIGEIHAAESVRTYPVIFL